MDVEEFRAGLRVLAVDDDCVSLMLIAKQLQLCKYNVTTVMHPEVALEMLRARIDDEDQFDLVITDVHMPGMDGFKLLEHIGLEMDIPVIMLSANDTLETMMKGIQHGARDYLVKPVCLEQLKRLWIHAVRKLKDDPSNDTSSGTDNDDGQSENGANHNMRYSKKKKKHGDNAREDREQTSRPKRKRIQWSGDLHRKFVKVVDELGIHKAVPKKIVETMNVEGLTREHVASHLQKYRLYLKKVSNGGTFRRRTFADETLWSQGNSININSQQRFEHNLEHGRYPPSALFAGSSSSSDPFARMNSPAAFGKHGLLPTRSVQLMTQRNLGIPVKDMRPVGYGGNMPQIAASGSQQGLNSFTSAGNSNTNICFPSGTSGSSFNNISNGVPFHTSKPFPSGTLSNTFANIPNGSSQYGPFKSYTSLLHGNFDGASRGIHFVDDDNFFENMAGGEMLPPSSNDLLMQPPETASFGFHGSLNSGKTAAASKFLDLGCKGATFEAGPSQGNMHKINRLSRFAAMSGQNSEFQNQMTTLTRTSAPMSDFNEQVAPFFNIGSNMNTIAVTNENSATLPNLQMSKHVVPNQMLVGGEEDGKVVGDQLNNRNESITATNTAPNGTNDPLDDFFSDWLNHDIFSNDNVFMDGDWEFAP